MADPLAQVIELLRPQALFSKASPAPGAGLSTIPLSVIRASARCSMDNHKLLVDGAAPALLSAGDFVLLPATQAFTMSGLEPATPK